MVTKKDDDDDPQILAEKMCRALVMATVKYAQRHEDPSTFASIALAAAAGRLCGLIRGGMGAMKDDETRQSLEQIMLETDISVSKGMKPLADAWRAIS